MHYCFLTVQRESRIGISTVFSLHLPCKYYFLAQLFHYALCTEPRKYNLAANDSTIRLSQYFMTVVRTRNIWCTRCNMCSRVYQAPLGFYNAIIPTKQFTQRGNFDAFYRVISVPNIRSTGGRFSYLQRPSKRYTFSSNNCAAYLRKMCWICMTYMQLTLDLWSLQVFFLRTLPRKIVLPQVHNYNPDLRSFFFLLKI